MCPCWALGCREIHGATGSLPKHAFSCACRGFVAKTSASIYDEEVGVYIIAFSKHFTPLHECLQKSDSFMLKEPISLWWKPHSVSTANEKAEHSGQGILGQGKSEQRQYCLGGLSLAPGDFPFKHQFNTCHPAHGASLCTMTSGRDRILERSPSQPKRHLFFINLSTRCNVMFCRTTA